MTRPARAAIAPVAPLVALCVAWPAAAAPHDDHPGNDAVAHHVRLTGWAKDNDRKRRELQTTREACESNNKALGRPVAPLPATGLPSIVQPMRFDIYYAPNRTIVAMQSELNAIDPADCSLQVVLGDTISVDSQAGQCTINRIDRVAQGQCDLRAHLRAAPGMRNLFPSGAARRAAEAAARPVAMLPTGETRVLAGQPCKVHRSELLKREACVAAPPGGEAARLAMRTSTLNRGAPGVLLEADTPELVLKAQSVRFDQPISDAIMAIPAGTKVVSIPPTGPFE